MSTTEKTTAATGRRDGDELLSQIDDVTRAGGDVQADADPDPLEARLRLILPGHTFFQIGGGNQVPDAVSQFAERLGAIAVGSISSGPSRYVKAIWSTPTGVWLVKGHTHGEDGAYHVVIDGVDTDITRDGLTVDQTVDLLRAVGAIPSGS